MLKKLKIQSPKDAFNEMVSDLRDEGKTHKQIIDLYPTFKQIQTLRTSQNKIASATARMDSLAIMHTLATGDDKFVIQEQLVADGQSSPYLLCGTKDMLRLLAEHGQNVFFLDGMHGIDDFPNNQMVTINVRIGNKGYPCAYLITVR